MTQDLSGTLQVFRFELNYLQQGHFDNSRALLTSESPFQGNFVCLNRADPLQAHACHECLLFPFVPDEKRNEEIPCRHIPVSDSGESVAQLVEQNSPERIREALEHWLHATIEELEATLARNATVGNHELPG